RAAAFGFNQLRNRCRCTGCGVSGDPYAPNDEPLRCRTNEVERIARHEGQDFVRAWVQYRDIRRAHDPDGNDPIAVIPSDCRQLDDVVLPDVSQWPEEG